MKMVFSLSSLCLTLLAFNSFASTELVSSAKVENKQQQQHNIEREAGFKQTEQQLRHAKAELEAQRQDLQAQADKLSTQFSNNENRLARLEEQLRLETGSLGELFGVVRQNAKALSSELESSITAVDRHQYTSRVQEIVAAKSLPSMPQLTGLWHSYVEQIIASGELSRVQIAFINGDGVTKNVAAYRIGTFGLVTEQGYVKWNGDKQAATAYLKQPDNGPIFSGLNTGEIESLVVDPSRGIMLEQLALTPTLAERLQMGGAVGNIILVLLGIGLIIAFYRGFALVMTHHKIKAQLKDVQKIGNNPLGRVLSVYNKEQNRSVEALELRLLEAVVDEQAHLEKGLSMLKLLAAIAPMLGLLGTVTGMIETFQVITQFGNGDPKVMAGGISMALVTTVLGLVSAIPLLLAHNILSSQAENIRSILEKQGIGLVAAQAEQECQASMRNAA
uniref:MotA/TolQ/ExbB proton channel family protein n=1 Tax=Vibrio anguillarum TaxID=55601 RepID=UPI0040474E43